MRKKRDTSELPTEKAMGLLSSSMPADADLRAFAAAAVAKVVGDRNVDVLTLWLDGHSIRRIAELCSLPRSTVMRRLSTARLRLFELRQTVKAIKHGSEPREPERVHGR